MPTMEKFETFALDWVALLGILSGMGDIWLKETSQKAAESASNLIAPLHSPLSFRVMARKMTLLSRRSKPSSSSIHSVEVTDHAPLSREGASAARGQSSVSCIAGKSLPFPSNHVAPRLASYEMPSKQRIPISDHYSFWSIAGRLSAIKRRRKPFFLIRSNPELLICDVNV